MENAYWFRSTQFPVNDDEDGPADPASYGESLAQWLAVEFSALGYKAEVICEDWGWCVMCVRGDFLLWIACGCSEIDPAGRSATDGPPSAESIVWGVYTVIEVPFFMLRSLLRKWTGRLDLSAPLDKLGAQLHAMLAANPSITFCEEP
jgi:hypothetical protein